MQQSEILKHNLIRSKNSGGFTLIELLVVITIIVLLAGMLTLTVGVARRKAAEAEIKSAITSIDAALSNFKNDEDVYPGFRKAWDGEDENHNAFPEIFDALVTETKTRWEPKKDRIFKKSDEPDVNEDGEEVDTYIEIESEDLYDPEIKKYFVDAWDNPLVYRVNNLIKRKSWMHNPTKFDLWSFGADSIDQSRRADEMDDNGPNDDIGNW